MVLSTQVSAAAGYIVKTLTSLEEAKTAKRELSTALWQWVRPLLLVDAPEAVAKTDNATKADAVRVQNFLASALYTKAASDPAFMETLKQHLQDIQNAWTFPFFKLSKGKKRVTQSTPLGDFYL